MKVITSFVSEGADKVNQHITNLQNGIKQINNTKTKIRIDNSGIQESIKAYGFLSNYLNDLEQQFSKLGNKASSVGKEMKKQIDGINKALTEFKTAAGKDGKVSTAVYDSINSQKMQVELKKQLDIEKQITAEIQKQQRQMEQLHKKAQEVGGMAKSILQDKNLNQKGAKDTAAQWDYQRDAIQRMATEIKNAENAGEAYEHMLESIAYEVKHTSGKSLFQDSIDGTKKLINLENKRYDAQKSGKKIMEDFYNTEIKKQKDVLENINATANDPKKFEAYLRENADFIKGMLPEDMQEDFQKQFESTGIIDNAWAAGMKKYVAELQRAYQEQVKLNQEKNKQNTQDNQYKNLKMDLQEIWNIENKIVQLQKDPKKNAAQIQYYQQLLGKKREELNLTDRINDLTEEQKKDVEKLKKEQEEYNTLLKKQNQDWKANQKSAQGFGDTIKKVFNYVLVYKFFNLLQEGIRTAIETMKDLDKAFTDIQMVTGDTDEQTAQLAQDYNKLAKSLGATTQEVAEGAAEWLRQGKTTEETTQLLQSSMVLSKVGAMEASEATELLTSTLNGYKLEAKDAMAVVDRISSIDLAAATSSYELATALSRTANSAKDAGVTFEKLLAMIGTVSSVTRKSASTIRRII